MWALRTKPTSFIRAVKCLQPLSQLSSYFISYFLMKILYKNWLDIYDCIMERSLSCRFFQNVWGGGRKPAAYILCHTSEEGVVLPCLGSKEQWTILSYSSPWILNLLFNKVNTPLDAYFSHSGKPQVLVEGWIHLPFSCSLPGQLPSGFPV